MIETEVPFLLALPPLSALSLKITLVLCLAWILHFGLRKCNPRWRVLLWRGSICGVILIPFISTVIATFEVEVPRVPAIDSVFQASLAHTVSRTPAVRRETAAEQPQERPSPADRDTAQVSKSPPDVPTQQAETETISAGRIRFDLVGWLVQNSQDLLKAVWLLGILLFAVRLVTASRWLRKVAKSSSSAPRHVEQVLRRVARDFGSSREIRLRFSPAIDTPFLCGVRHPLILLPEGMRQSDFGKELPAVFAHELGHLRTNDLWWFAGIQWFQVILWFHPLVWRVHSAHTAACEEVSDLVATNYVGSPVSYSQTLARLMLEFIGRTRALAGIPMARTSDIRRRLENLKAASMFAPLTRRRIVFLGLLGCAALIGIGGLQPVTTSAVMPSTLDRRTMTLQRVIEGIGADLSSLPTPDGKFITDVDQDSGNLVLRELATGTTHQLTHVTDSGQGFAQNSAISPDGMKVAYSWYHDNAGRQFCDLRVIGLDGSEPRVLFSSEEVNDLNPLEWSSDGERIMALIYTEGGGETVLISVADGFVQSLKSLNEPPSSAWLSPDGRYIAYDVPQQEGSSNRDIFLLAVSEDRETPLVVHPADDQLLGWSPDGKWILFASDRWESEDAWVIRVADGQVQGPPERIKNNLGSVVPKGFTADGLYYYAVEYQAQEIYVARLDPGAGEVVEPPSPIGFKAMYKLTPEWSHDGRYLVYQSWDDSIYLNDQCASLCIHAIETDEVRTISPEGMTRVGCPQWSPDVGFILIKGYERLRPQDPDIYQINVQTGELTLLASCAIGTGPYIFDCSPDGETLFYQRYDEDTGNCAIVMRDITTGREKELCSDPTMTPWALTVSPDGRQLAFSTYDGDMQLATVKIIPSGGGEPQDLFRLLGSSVITCIQWVPDGRDLLFVSYDPGGASMNQPTAVWKVSATGGIPEKIWEPELQVTALRVHPDGQRIAFSGGQRLKHEVWVMEDFLPVE